MNFAAKVIRNSRKVHRCLLCCRDIPVGSIYIVSPYKDDKTGKFEAVKMCHECAYLIQQTDQKHQFKEGNLTDTNIPNKLRKIRSEYRKDPMKAWDEQNKKEIEK